MYMYVTLTLFIFSAVIYRYGIPLVHSQGVTKLNPQITEPFNLNFQSLELVSRYRDPQLQVTENLCYL